MKKMPDEKVSDRDREVQLQYISLLKDKLKFKIMMLLLVYGELNVTRISNLLSQSKATVSRHLNEMEGVIVRYDEAFKDREIEGRITPKYYRIDEEFLRLIRPVEGVGNMDDAEGQMRFNRQVIELLRTGVEVSKESLDLVNPMLDYLESQTDAVSAKEAFGRYVLEDGVTLGITFMSREQYLQFMAAQEEALRKMMESPIDEPKDVPRPYMYIGSVIDVGKMLEIRSKRKKD